MGWEGAERLGQLSPGERAKISIDRTGVTQLTLQSLREYGGSVCEMVALRRIQMSLSCPALRPFDSSSPTSIFGLAASFKRARFQSGFFVSFFCFLVGLVWIRVERYGR